MEYEFGLKELYFVTIKATSPIEINGKIIEKGEVIAAFDKILLADFDEDKKFVTAHGGYQDEPRVWWETSKDIRLSFRQGIFSKTQLSLMTNTKLFNHTDELPLFIPIREILETDEYGNCELKYIPYQPFFVYDKKTGNKIECTIEGNKLKTNLAYNEFVIDYYFKYDNGAQLLKFGNVLSNGYFRLEGKTRVKDDITGQTKTGLITIPKLKLMSDLSMRLGREANPVVTSLNAIACPVDSRGVKTVMDILLLEDDIDSDI